MRLPQLTFGKVLGGTAVLILAASGTAYAVDTVGSSDIIDGSIKSVDVKDESLGSVDFLNNNLKSDDLKDGGVGGVDLADSSVSSAKIVDGTITGADIADGSVGTDDVTNESLTSSDLATDSVNATEVADNSIDAGEIVDFGLTNEDIGVLYAQINADGTVANSSGGVTSSRLGAGTYVVDFGRNISFCGFFSTQGEAGVGGAGGAVTGVTDRAGNANAVFATTRANGGGLLDTAFQILVVC